MSNDNTAEAKAEDNTPGFALQKIYVKDTSFENPNAPEIFVDVGSQLNVEMSLDMDNRQINDDHWEMSLKVSIKTRHQGNDKLLFEIEVEHAAIFLIKNIPAEHIPMVLAVDCPLVIFPYTRQIVSQLTVDGGFMPFLMEPVNFRALYDNKLKEAEAEAAGATVQ